MHLVENYYRDWKLSLGESIVLPRKLPIQEGMKIIEGDKSFDVFSKYEVPVWRLNQKNLNGRTYSESLAKIVIKENKITNSLGNHPPEQSEGSVFDIVAVTRNPHIREEILYVDCYFVDKTFQEKVDKIIEFGSTIGLSSSAYGDLDAMGNVLEEGFTVERYCDFVLNPSYEVYLSGDSRAERKESVVSTKVITNNNVSPKKESVVKSTKEKHIMTIEEKNLKHNLKKLMTEAKAKTNFSEKLEVYEEALEYCEDVDFAASYVQDIMKEVDLVKKEMGALAEKGKTAPALEETVKIKEKEAVSLTEKVATLQREVNEMQEKYDISCQFLDDMKARETKLKEMYDLTLAEKNGMVNPTDYKELSIYTESLEKQYEALKRENTKFKKRITSIIEAAAKKGMKITIKEAEEKDDKDEDKEDEKKKEETRKRKVREADEEKEDEDEKKDKKDMKEAESKDKNDEEREKEDKEDKEEAEKKMKEAAEKDDEDEDEDDMEEGISIRNNPMVKNYYNEMVAENSNVKKIKEEILSCKTLIEAQKVYLNMLDLIEEGHSTAGLIGEEVEQDRRAALPTGRPLVRPGWM